MTFPKKETMIPFGEAQKAVECITEAYNHAIAETIEDEELRTRVMAAAAGYVFQVMMARIQADLNAQQAGATNDQQAFDEESNALFNRLFGDDG